MTQIDLFSGIGGFALAAYWAGFTTEVFCEKDEFCQQVLRKHWPSVPIVGDIHQFDGTRYHGAALLTGGFPCQPFSVAGKQRGESDDRFLWPEMLRVIREARPHWIVGENVAGIINMALDGVLADLENEGYATQAFCLPACGVNAPHKRDRVWIVAHTAASRDWKDGTAKSCQNIPSLPEHTFQQLVRQGDPPKTASNAMANSDRGVRQSSPIQRYGVRVQTATERTNPHVGGTSDGPKAMADATRNARQFQSRQRQDLRDQPAINGEKGATGTVGRFTQSRLGDVADGLPARLAGHFDAEPAIPRIATGIPQRAAKLKALGNAIVPQVAYEILRYLQEIQPCYE